MANFDIYSMVTERIIAELEKGIIPWRKPWKTTGPQITKVDDIGKVAFNRTTLLAYSALNQMMLKKTGEYATYKQWHEMGGWIKAGAKAEIVVFWKWLETSETDGATGDILIKRIPVLKYYKVFHIDDVEDIKPLTKEYFDALQSEQEKAITFDSEEQAENIITTYSTREKLEIIYGGNQAYYSPMYDHIVIPDKHKFSKMPEYYSTIFHEITHSTGAKQRLNRLNENGLAFFGNEAYSKEELVAELGASGMLSMLDIETPSSFTNSAAYIQSWLQALRNDKRLVVSAAGKAEKAIEYILNGKKETEGNTNDEETN